MNNKNFMPMLWLCVGLSTISSFIVTLITYIQTQSLLSMIVFIICLIGSVVFWITFIIAFIQFKK